MSKFKFRIFLLSKLPIAWIAGVKLHSYSKDKVSTQVKYKWLNQNPFKSMFWAVQGMAAEFTTGFLCFNIIRERKAKISMLIIKQKGNFYKKIKGKVIFSCNQGKEIEQVIQTAIDTGEAQTIDLYSTGYINDEKVAEFVFRWSFKAK